MSLIPSFPGGRRSNAYGPFSLDVWDSFNGSPSPSSWAPPSVRETFPFACPRVDWKETPEAHVFEVNLPGVKKEEVKIEVDKANRVLQISGMRSVEKEEWSGSSSHRVERSCGKFVRRFWLPENAKMNRVKASINNGVVTVTVPKVETKKSDLVFIEITA